MNVAVNIHTSSYQLCNYFNFQRECLGLQVTNSMLEVQNLMYIAAQGGHHSDFNCTTVAQYFLRSVPPRFVVSECSADVVSVL